MLLHCWNRCMGPSGETRCEQMSFMHSTSFFFQWLELSWFMAVGMWHYVKLVLLLSCRRWGEEGRGGGYWRRRCASTIGYCNWTDWCKGRTVMKYLAHRVIPRYSQFWKRPHYWSHRPEHRNMATHHHHHPTHTRTHTAPSSISLSLLAPITGNIDIDIFWCIFLVLSRTSGLEQNVVLIVLCQGYF